MCGREVVSVCGRERGFVCVCLCVYVRIRVCK